MTSAQVRSADTDARHRRASLFLEGIARGRSASRKPGHRTLRLAVFGLALALAPSVTLATAATITNGLSLLERSYLFNEELEPDRLLGESLEYLERMVPGIVASAGPDGYTLSTADCTLRFEAPPEARIPDLEGPLRRIESLLGPCIRELPEKLPDLEILLLRAAVSGLDPYTTVLSEKGRTEHTIHFRGRLAGIGARIGIRDDRLTLIKVYPGSPAAGAGLRDEDVVLRIDDLSATNILVSDAVDRIRGEVGTVVLLTISRRGEEQSRQIRVTRGLVTIPSVTVELLDDDIVYAEISHFSQTTPDDFRTRVSELTTINDIRGVVIDLRANSGGSMLGASAIGDRFLADGLLISTAGRGGHAARGLTSQVQATADTPFAALPVAFLTSSRTASGSELLAASLRNHDRAIVFGQSSFGKGTVQKTYTVASATTLKMTVGHFLPNGRPIPGGGLIPDVETRLYLFRDGVAVLAPARDPSDLPFWLRHPSWASAPEDEPSALLAYGRARTAEEEDENDDDPTRDLAAAVLRGYGSTSAAATLATARDFLDARAREADADLTSFLGARGLDWSPGKRPAKHAALELQVAAAPELAAGETSTVTVRIGNPSGAAISRLRGNLESNAPYLDGKAVLFGRLEAGESRTWEVETTTPVGERRSRVSVAAELRDDEGALGTIGPVYVTVEPTERPRLAYRYLSQPAAEPGLLDVTLEVANRGDGPSSEIRARIKHPLDGGFEIVEGGATLESLGAGETARLLFSLRLLGSFETAPLATVYLNDAAFGTFLAPKIPLGLAAAYGPWEEPPRIHVTGIADSGDAAVPLLRVSVHDDGGLDRVVAWMGDDVVKIVEPGGARKNTIVLEIPWDLGSEVNRLNIVATDASGLTSRYGSYL